MNIHFSKHAFDRVRERLRLSSFQVKALFEKAMTVPLGIEEKSNRSHDLFFSVMDNACFVAVRDINDGTIVTIVPAEWHNKWRISIDAMTLAKRLANGETVVSSINLNKVQKPIINESPSKLKVRGHIGYHIVNLGSLDISKYNDADTARKSGEAVRTMLKKAKEKEIDINSIDAISINNGGKSEFTQYQIDRHEGKFLLY